jgi:hypothetical protein
MKRKAGDVSASPALKIPAHVTMTSLETDVGCFASMLVKPKQSKL